MAIRHAKAPTKKAPTKKAATNSKSPAKKGAPGAARPARGRADQPPDMGNDERAIVRKNQKPRSARQSNRGA
jgi:hypothetical protein